MGAPCRDDGVRQRLPRRHTQSTVVEEGALAFFGGEQLVGNRVIDQPGDQLALAFKGDGDRE
jgi:hypothetical protein